mgnify:FL=1
MLSVEHVTKRYGKFTALEDLSLTFTPGVYGLLAPNGAGKTTLIKMLTTLLFPTRGQILWDGEDIQTLGETYRAQLGYLPQTFGYYPSYTPRQFLRYAAALQRIPPAEVEGRIADRLKQVGLEEVADQKMRKFSGGMLQRTGIALAILGDPKLLILDEPTAGLDIEGRAALHRQIRQLKQQGKTILLASHDMTEVESLCDRLAILVQGTLAFLGTPTELRNQVGRRYTLSLQTTQGTETYATENIGDTLLTVLTQYRAEGKQVLDLQVSQGSLEEYFLQIVKGEGSQ